MFVDFLFVCGILGLRLWAPTNTRDENNLIANAIAHLAIMNDKLHEVRCVGLEQGSYALALTCCDVSTSVVHSICRRISNLRFSDEGWLTIVEALCGKQKSRLPAFGYVWCVALRAGQVDKVLFSSPFATALLTLRFRCDGWHCWLKVFLCRSSPHWSACAGCAAFKRVVSLCVVVTYPACRIGVWPQNQPCGSR